MFKDVFLGVSTFFQSIGFIWRNKLVHFYLYPILFAALLFWVSALGKDVLLEFIDSVIFDSWGLDRWVERDGTGEGIIDGIFYWLFSVLIWILILIINRYIVLIFLSPVFSILSEKVEHILTGNDYPFSMKQVMKDALKGSFLAIRNLAIELFIIATCVIVKMIFAPASIVTIPIMTLTAWYFMGYSFLYYNHERQRLKIGESSKIIWKRKGLTLSNGMLFTILAYIPILGVTFGAIWATTGATLALHKGSKKEQLTGDSKPKAVEG